MRIVFLYIILLLCGARLWSQEDTIIKKKKFLVTTATDSTLDFTGTRIVDKDLESETAKIVIGGYVSTYYAHYSDETETNGFVQFPTMAARNDQFGLNMAQITMEYTSKNIRSNITLHYGDIPASSWPAQFNLIQEAHAGVKLFKNVWLDAGFFKTHLGIESIQPRENITSSMAVLTYYEPYYLSGAKLTWEVNKKLSLQVNMFNGFNEYIEDNKNKALGFSALYEVNHHIAVTFNFMECDETLDNEKIRKPRYYSDLYATFKYNRLSFGIEANYGVQKHSVLKDSSKTATMFSALVVAKYQFIKKLYAYARGEYFSDPNQILTGTLHIGDYIYGGTFGLEYKPFKNVGLSCESRLLQADNLIFKQHGYYTNQRYEIIGCLDLWF